MRRREKSKKWRKWRFVKKGKYKKTREEKMSSEGWRDRRQLSLDIHCPVILGGVEVIASVDTCADFLLGSCGRGWRERSL